MTLGQRSSQAVVYSWEMAADDKVSKGDVVTLDSNDRVTTASTDEDEPVGVAAETIDTGTGENPQIGVVVHGIAGVTADAAVNAGEMVKVSQSDNAGQVEPLNAQSVDEGGTATYDIEPGTAVGMALEDLSAGGEGDILVTPGAGVPQA